MISAAKVIERARVELSKLIVAQSPQSIRQCRANGAQLLVLANEDVGRRICFGGGYERHETALLKRMIQKTDICFDVGANVGYFTMLMAKSADAGEIHAFEPQKLAHSLLSASVELNGFRHVVANNCAVGERAGRASFSVSEDSAYSSLIDTGRKPEKCVVEVEVATIDDYCLANALDRIDILKIDVEGAEERVLKGASRMLEAPSSGPRMIMLELYGPNLDPFGSSVDAILDLLARGRYSPHVVAAPGAGLVPLKPSMIGKFYNVIFLKS